MTQNLEGRWGISCLNQRTMKCSAFALPQGPLDIRSNFGKNNRQPWKFMTVSLLSYWCTHPGFLLLFSLFPRTPNSHQLNFGVGYIITIFAQMLTLLQWIPVFPHQTENQCVQMSDFLRTPMVQNILQGTESPQTEQEIKCRSLII